jgi:hypothetical protein
MEDEGAREQEKASRLLEKLTHENARPVNRIHSQKRD